MEPPMTVKELSDYLRLDRMTIYKMLKEGSIPASRIGHQWRFFREDIDEWIRSLRKSQRTSVLVIDGDPNVGRLFDEELPTESFDVVVMPTGEEAISLASRRSFDVAFIELKKATLEVFRYLRKTDDTMPVVVSATNPDSRLVDEAMEIGTFTLVKKPRTGGELQSIMSGLPIKRSPAL